MLYDIQLPNIKTVKEDGNLVLYKGLLAVYDSNTAGHTTQVTMKTNGDLVVTEGGVS